ERTSSCVDLDAGRGARSLPRVVPTAGAGAAGRCTCPRSHRAGSRPRYPKKGLRGGPLPAIIFMHGGGFCIGDRDTHDTICRKLANAGHCAAISVEYRLAPEHKFPAAIEDCARAVGWIEKQASALAIHSKR